MISTLKFRFGRAPGAPAETLQVAPVTIFVGPNNSGKTRALWELHQFCTLGRAAEQNVVVDDISLVPRLPAEEIPVHVARIASTPDPNERLNPGHMAIGPTGNKQHIQRAALTAALESPQAYRTQFCNWYLRYETTLLDGAGRLGLSQQQPGGDLQHFPTNRLQKLFVDDDRRAQLRAIIADAIGSFLVVDPTNLGSLRLRLSLCPPSSATLERGIHKEALEFHSAATHIELASDGIKAFVGILIEVFAGDPRVLLIDEPEAFLHPSLAYALGREMTRAVVGSDKRIFAATHSSHFLMGCLQSGAPVNIVRLTHRHGRATARVLASDDIVRLMRNPLLRSTGVLNALFYESVVVSEADTDRAFYQEVNERLLRFLPEWGIPNCLFLNAQNKQTVPTIVSPLRELGIPAAGIVDIDALKDGGTTWSTLLRSAFVPEISQQALATHRLAIKQALEKTGKDMKRDGGVALLATDEADSARTLLAQLADYGIFLVPGGEVESWLRHLAVKATHGPPWLVEMFEKMGEDPDSPGYERPARGDVWEFMGKVRIWLQNQSRKGIPS